MLDNGDFCPIVAPWMHLWDLAYYIVRAKRESKMLLKLDS